MCRFLLAASLVVLSVGLSGCGVIGGGGSETVVPAPRQPADDDEAAPPTPAVPQAVAKGQAIAKGKEPAPKLEEPRHNISEADRRARVINKLRLISAALESFKRAAEHYPDQSAGGLSWRVALLPYLGLRPLYQKFRLDEPWDSEHNRPLLKQIPDAFQSVERPGEKTSFLLITGPGTAYPVKAGLTEDRCPDGLQNTLLLAEVADHLMKPWTQPDDYVFDRANAQRDLFSLRKDCCFVVLGSPSGVRQLSSKVTDSQLLALLSPAGGEPVSASDVTTYPTPEVDLQLIANLERNPPVRFPPPVQKPQSTSEAGTENGTTPATAAVPRKEASLPTDPRLPVPDDKALAAATALAKELHKAGFESKKPAEKRAFAKRMLDLGSKFTGDPAGMYVLLSVARDLGAQGGDLDTALAAVNKLGTTFRVDPLPMKVKVLEQAVPAIESLAEAGVLYAKSLEVESEMVARDDFDGAKRSLAVALNAARRSGRREVVDQVTARRERLDELKRAFDRVSAALLTLVRSPNDVSANGAVGRYLCLVKEDWPRGLPLLARGDDEKLRALASAELKNPHSPEEQTTLADRWWDWSDKLGSTQLSAAQLSPMERRNARSRAAYWYKHALPALPANLASERVKQRIADAEKDDRRPKPTGSSTKSRNDSAG